MPILKPDALKAQAATRLQDSSARKLVFIHTGVLLLLSVLASALHLLLDSQIDATGGLSGLGTRSVLQTIQAIIQYGSTLFSPFWNAGFTLVVMRFASGHSASVYDLTGGFRRWSAVLSQQLFTMFLFFGIGISSGYLAALVFSMTPFADPLAQALEPIMISGTMDLTLIPPEVMTQASIPLTVIYLMIFLPTAGFLLLNFRLSSFFLMDEPRMSGLMAMRASTLAMHGNRLKMLKLDLSFWWYYLIELLLALVCYLDVILPFLGITLPVNETVAYFAALLLYAALELAFHLWKKPYVDTTYALAYQHIRHHLEESPQD